MIVKTPKVCGGRARIDGTRLTVEGILDMFSSGMNKNEIIDAVMVFHKTRITSRDIDDMVHYITRVINGQKEASKKR
jgi:uncharacterized protein (DUF433 family)